MTEQTLNYITYGLTGFVVLAFIWALVYFFIKKNNDELISKRRWIEGLPTLMSSLGVLGTFVGITMGLMNFDPNDLDASIPLLLSGLKTAFFTSLAGMVGSIILSKLVSSGFDQKDQGVSDINQAAGLISQSISKMEKSSEDKMDEMSKQLEKFTESQNGFMISISKFMESQNKISQNIADSIAIFSNDTKEIKLLLENKLEGIETKSETSLSKLAEVKDAINSTKEAVDITKVAIDDSKDLVYKVLINSEQAIKEAIFNSSDNISGSVGNVERAVIANTDVLKETISDVEKVMMAQLIEEAALLEKLSEKLGVINGTIDSKLESLTISVGNVEENVGTQADFIKSINENVAEIVETSTGTYTTQSEIIEEIQKLSPVIRDEVTEIEEKMKETNVLLTDKFNEFSELLKKSNTEALVEVMKAVTLEFEKQMNALIGKLIKENFEQLNESVGRMITWQEENKNMISSLTSKYNQMNTSFETTSTTLKDVESDTKRLLTDGGKLHQIVLGLEQVMSKDKDFVATAKAMKDAAEANARNVAEYQTYTQNLNKWVDKQKNFADSVNDLIKKLEELDKLRDYSNDFWAEAKKNLMDAQKRLHDSAQFLQGEIQTLDQHFYNRLSETLSQLDVCIQAMVNKNK
jgi:hypothetical protein